MRTNLRRVGLLALSVVASLAIVGGTPGVAAAAHGYRPAAAPTYELRVTTPAKNPKFGTGPLEQAHAKREEAHAKVAAIKAERREAAAANKAAKDLKRYGDRTVTRERWTDEQGVHKRVVLQSPDLKTSTYEKVTRRWPDAVLQTVTKTSGNHPVAPSLKRESVTTTKSTVLENGHVEVEAHKRQTLKSKDNRTWQGVETTQDWTTTHQMVRDRDGNVQVERTVGPSFAKMSPGELSHTPPSAEGRTFFKPN